MGAVPLGGEPPTRCARATATLVVIVCTPLAAANTSVEIHLTELLTPPPTGVRWLITALWFLGSLGVVITLLLVGLLVPRLAAVRQMALARAAAAAVCLLIDVVLGSAVGRPSSSRSWPSPSPWPSSPWCRASGAS
jgi:hypothetical protein